MKECFIDNACHLFNHMSYQPHINHLRSFLCDDVLTHIADYLKPTFKDNKEFKQGIKLWFSNQSGCIQQYGHISNWNTENITDMSFAFMGRCTFNEPIGNWDTRQVTDMKLMFHNARVFNQPIGNWDTSQVTNMSGMFKFAVSFNQPIGNWNTSQVTDVRMYVSRAY